MGKIFMIMGKSATGKDHIYDELLADKSLGLKAIVLYTTRPMRRGEADGREYYFTDTKRLEELRSAGKIIEERVYPTVHGDWHYCTVDDGQIDRNKNYITIGTLQSFVKIRDYFGADVVIPIYIQSDPYLRLMRSAGRERKQEKPEYKEVCRRFLADEEDFSEEKLKSAGVAKRFLNDDELRSCIDEVRGYIKREIRKHDGI